MSQANNPGAVVVDSNVLISICSKENSHATADQALAGYAAQQWPFYATGRSSNHSKNKKQIRP